MSSLQQKILLSAVALLGMGVMIVLASTTSSEAQGPVLPTPTNVPNGGTGRGSKKSDSGPLLARIELQAQSAAPAGAWSVVQWRDTTGNWHDVEGWRNMLQPNGYQSWTVEAKDFNSGPFRWVVRRGQTGSVAGVSNLFHLPAGANQTERVMIILR